MTLASRLEMDALVIANARGTHRGNPACLYCAAEHLRAERRSAGSSSPLVECPSYRSGRHPGAGVGSHLLIQELPDDGSCGSDVRARLASRDRAVLADSGKVQAGPATGAGNSAHSDHDDAYDRSRQAKADRSLPFLRPVDNPVETGTEGTDQGEQKKASVPAQKSVTTSSAVTVRDSRDSSSCYAHISRYARTRVAGLSQKTPPSVPAVPAVLRQVTE